MAFGHSVLSIRAGGGHRINDVSILMSINVFLFLQVHTSLLRVTNCYLPGYHTDSLTNKSMHMKVFKNTCCMLVLQPVACSRPAIMLRSETARKLAF